MGIALLLSAGTLNFLPAMGQGHPPAAAKAVILDTAFATRLAEFPLRCVDKPFPYKTGVSYGDKSFITEPREYHPAFYGCFDWHSSVHGHWMLARLLRLYPGLPQASRIRDVFDRHLAPASIQRELGVFRDPENRGFERTYGWAWLLMLQRELDAWQDPAAARWAAALQPLSDTIVSYTQKYLAKLAYPIRTGEHNNLAFGLAFMHDYAISAHHEGLRTAIESASQRFYGKDASCPLGWEPSGSDFLSPCLEEADLMRRVLPKDQYLVWLRRFLPAVFRADFQLATGRVNDRTDGKLIHLDGLNFSRAWCLVPMAKAIGSQNLASIAETHLKDAIRQLASGEYAGEHWLASFAVYALTYDR